MRISAEHGMAASRRTAWRSDRGVALSVAMMSALFSAIAIYVIMLLMHSQARQARFFRLRTAARYTAEAGLIWAQQQLAVIPPPFSVTSCFSANPDVTLDHDGNPATPEVGIDVTATPCPAVPPDMQLEARVVY